MGRTTKVADTLANITITETTSTDKDVLARQYVAPLKAGQAITPSQAIKFQVRAQESNAANNMFTALCIRICNVAGAVQLIMLGVTRDGVEMVASPTAATNRQFTATSAATSYTTVAGDYLVIEIGAGGDPTSTNPHTYLLRLGDSAAADLAEDDTSTTDNNPWVQLTDTLILESSITGAFISSGSALFAPTTAYAISMPTITAGTVLSAPSLAYAIQMPIILRDYDRKVSVATSAFTGTENPLSESSVWAQAAGIPQCAKSSGVAVATSTGRNLSARSGSLGNSYAKAVIQGVADRSALCEYTVHTRIQSNGSCYSAFWYVDTTGDSFMVVYRTDCDGSSGDFTLDTQLTGTVHIGRLLITGDEIGLLSIDDKHYGILNGRVLSVGTDATYSAGKTGIGFYAGGAGVISSASLDSFESGNAIKATFAPTVAQGAADQALTGAFISSGSQLFAPTTAYAIQMPIIANETGAQSVADSYATGTDTVRMGTNPGGSGLLPAYGQSFHAPSDVPRRLISGSFNIKKVLAPTGNIYMKLYEHSGVFGTSSLPTGIALAASAAVDVATLGTSFADVTFTFSDGVLIPGRDYVITVEYTGGDSSNYVEIQGTLSGGTGHAGNGSNIQSGAWLDHSLWDLRFSLLAATMPTLYAPTVALEQALTGAFISSGNALFAPTLAYAMSLPTISLTALFAPILAYAMSMPTIASTVTLYAPSITITVTKTATGNYEALINIASPRVSNWESLIGVAKTRASDWEALIGIASGRVSDFEARLGITSARATDWESLFGIAETRASDWESLLGLAKTRATDWESLIGAAEARVSDWESLIGIAHTAVSDIEALIGIAGSRSDNYESAGQASSSRSTDYESLLAVAETRISDWESLVGIADARATDYESLLGLTKTRATDWESLINATEARSTDWESLISVAEARLTDWESLIGIAATRAANFESILSLTNGRTTDWESLIGVTKSRISDLESLIGVAQSFADNFEALAGITKARTSDWESLLGAASARSTDWESYGTLAVSRGTDYESLFGLTKSRTTDLESLFNLAMPAEIDWESAERVAESRTSNWESTVPAGSSANSVTSNYESLLALAVARATDYESLIYITATAVSDLEILLGGIAEARAAEFESLLGVVGTRSSDFESLIRIAESRNSNHEVLLKLAATRVSQLEILFGLAITGESNFESAKRVVMSDDSDYESLAPTGTSSTRTSNYEALLALAKTRTTDWESLLRVASARATEFEARIGVAKTVLSDWESLARASKSRNSNYEAIRQVASPRTANLEVLFHMTEARMTDLESLLGIAKSRQVNWQASGLASSSRGTGYEALAKVASSKVAALEILLGLAEAEIVDLEILLGVAATQDVNWYATGQTTSERTTNYESGGVPEVPPTMPGLEYASAMDRLHYQSAANRLRYQSAVNRLRYKSAEDRARYQSAVDRLQYQSSEED